MIFIELPRVGVRNRVHESDQKRYTSLWVGIASAVVSAGTAVYSSQQQKKAANKALDAQKQIASDLKYEPIDIEKLKSDATRAAIENATNSLAIERSLTPDIANTRSELSRQINADLALGGQLPTDVINRVTSAGRTIGARSGIGTGSTTPLTASLMGLSSIDLLNSRRAAAANLLSTNPLPVAGLSPNAIAEVEIANNNAQNQLGYDQAGIQSNLANSEAAARSAQIGGQVGVASSLAGLLGKIGSAYSTPGTTTSYDDLLKKSRTNTTYGNQNPATNTLMSSSPLGLA